MSELPLTATHTPNTSAELADLVKDAFARKSAIYPLGGQTSLHYGVPTKTPGLGISLAKLNRVIDYPHRDLTITVETGITLADLYATLATQRQQFPIDVPQSSQATLGGVIATNWNGPRRFGYGPLRDYVIGITAVDGQGMTYHGGGRVVKNVAGYDFCKLLTGSFGILGIITQVTLKVRPLPEKVSHAAVVLKTREQAHAWLEMVAKSSITPAAIELVSGASWSAQIATLQPTDYCGIVRLEGTKTEVEWMQREYAADLSRLSLSSLDAIDLEPVWLKLIEWPSDISAPLVLQANMRPSHILAFMHSVQAIDPQAQFLSHAGNGVVYVKFSVFPKEGLSRALVGKLQQAIATQEGHITILSNPSGAEMTHQCVWGGNDGSQFLMHAVKQQFDPAGILNPGRFVVG